MATLTAPSLQTSFLTPTFGFALFFLKGAAPPQVFGIGLATAFLVVVNWLPYKVLN